jgi:hypothetical protein
MVDTAAHESSRRIVDEVDRARAQEYALLATLLSRSPDSRLLLVWPVYGAMPARSA